MSAASGFDTGHNVCLFCDCVAEEEPVQCYDCRQWAHKKCADLSELEFKVLVYGDDTVQWVCRQCLSGQTEKRRWLEEKLDEMTKLVKQLTDQIETLEKSHTGATVEKDSKEVAEKAVKSYGKPAQMEEATFSLTETCTTEREETDRAETQKDKMGEMRGFVEMMSPPVLQEDTEEGSADREEARDLEPVMMKWVDQQRAGQSVDSGQSERPFLRYSRAELLQIPSTPLTPQVTSRLLDLGISGLDLGISGLDLGISGHSPSKPHQCKHVGLFPKLKYSRAELLQIEAAAPTSEVIARLQLLGISVHSSPTEHPRRDTRNIRYEPKMRREGGQPEAGPPPKSGRGAGRDGRFSCFLCEGGEFTAEGMEQHLLLCHQDQGEGGGGSTFTCPFCGFTSPSHGDCQAHIDAQHLGQTTSQAGTSHRQDCQSPPLSPGTSSSSSVVEDMDASRPVLEASLRLNDGPAEEEMEQNGQGEDRDSEGEEEEEVTEQNSLEGDRDSEEEEEEVSAEVDSEEEAGEEGEGGSKEESNLSIILSSMQSQQGEAGSQGRTPPGGARPKTRPPPEGSVRQETAPDPHPPGSRVDFRESRGLTYTCPFCSFCTRSEGEIQTHVSRLHLTDEDQEPGETSEQDILCLYSCPLCGRGFDTPKDLTHHIHTDHPDGEPGPSPAARSPREESCAGAWPGTSAGRGAGGELQCPVCGLVMHSASEDSLAAHVNQHFLSSPHPAAEPDSADDDLQMALQLQQQEEKRQQEDNDRLKNIQTRYGMDNTMTARQQFDRDLERAVGKGEISTSEYHSQKVAHTQSHRSGADDGSTQVSGVLERLGAHYSSGGGPRTVVRACLCSSTHHYGSSFGDSGWGCGYRNLQMLLSCLMTDPTYLQVLFNGRAKIPSIHKLQQLLESAWRKGFDPQGCEQLGGAVVNTRKWIGATDIVAMLSSLRIKCQLVDFVKPSGPKSTHPALLQWVRDYFTSSLSPFTPPLYLQHQGHSRTIVGMEELTNGNTNLLLFDPGVNRGRMEQFLDGPISYNLLQTVRRTANAFHARQYQIVAVVGVLNDQEYEHSKIIRSERKS